MVRQLESLEEVAVKVGVQLKLTNEPGMTPYMKLNTILSK